MNYADSFAISAIGMNIERARVDVAALNLANANTVHGAGGQSYQPLRVIAQVRDDARFGTMVGRGLDSAGSMAQLTPSMQVVATQGASRMVYEPSHPLANAQGFVAYAAVDPATEMVSMMSATRAYEANVSAMNTARTLALRALDIGSGA